MLCFMALNAMFLTPITQECLQILETDVLQQWQEQFLWDGAEHSKGPSIFGCTSTNQRYGTVLRMNTITWP